MFLAIIFIWNSFCFFLLLWSIMLCTARKIFLRIRLKISHWRKALYHKILYFQIEIPVLQIYPAMRMKRKINDLLRILSEIFFSCTKFCYVVQTSRLLYSCYVGIDLHGPVCSLCSVSRQSGNWLTWFLHEMLERVLIFVVTVHMI